MAKRTATDKPDLIAKLTAALERVRELPHPIAGFFRHPPTAPISSALWLRRVITFATLSNHPPAEPGAFVREPLEAAVRGR